jgi:group I intron endonuclease
LIKFGYLKFSLEILEYCEPKDVIKREQHYLNILKPEYNILKTAGSVLGLKHTEEIRAKIREASLGNKNMLGKTHTEETKAQIREAQKGNNSRLGKTHTE